MLIVLLRQLLDDRIFKLIWIHNGVRTSAVHAAAADATKLAQAGRGGVFCCGGDIVHNCHLITTSVNSSAIWNLQVRKSDCEPSTMDFSLQPPWSLENAAALPASFLDFCMPLKS